MLTSVPLIKSCLNLLNQIIHILLCIHPCACFEIRLLIYSIFQGKFYWSGYVEFKKEYFKVNMKLKSTLFAFLKHISCLIVNDSRINAFNAYFTQTS